MRAHFRGDRPLHGRDLMGGGGHNAPPPGRTKSSNSPAFLGLILQIIAHTKSTLALYYPTCEHLLLRSVQRIKNKALFYK